MKTTDDAAYIYALIAEGEHIGQDFKYQISDARKIARTLSAFSNTHGGRLLIGVKDNGHVAGVRSEEEVYMIEAAARLYCRPEVAVSMIVHKVEGRMILEVNIPPVACKPVVALDADNKGWAYVRVADENILATPVHLQLWRQGDLSYPDTLCFTEREHDILTFLLSREECSVSCICRNISLSRYVVQPLLARFVRWGIVAMRYDGRRFVYRCADND